MAQGGTMANPMAGGQTHYQAELTWEERFIGKGMKWGKREKEGRDKKKRKRQREKSGEETENRQRSICLLRENG